MDYMVFCLKLVLSLIIYNPYEKINYRPTTAIRKAVAKYEPVLTHP